MPPNTTRELKAGINSVVKGAPATRLLFGRFARHGVSGPQRPGAHHRTGRPWQRSPARNDAQRKAFALAPPFIPTTANKYLSWCKRPWPKTAPLRWSTGPDVSSAQWRTVWEQGRAAENGSTALVQGQLLDVTHRIQREQARLATELRLLQAQKFEALNQLAGGVAHEFNNLVAGILGSAELVAMDLPESHPGHETLKQIFEASNHARDFVCKLRAVGQRTAPEFKPIRLQPVLEECLQILRSIIPDKVELQVEIDADCPRVEADSAQIHQAILDLCLFAWQGLADRRGRIEVRLKTCPVVHWPAGKPHFLQPGPHLCLTVQDNSPGVETNVRDHIFHPFRSRRHGGTKVGLELFLVRETIRGHQGEIILESEPGRGLTFHLYLPVAAEDR